MPIPLTLLLSALPALSNPAQEDVAEVPSEDLLAGGTEHMRYYLIGAGEDAKPPRKGYRLLLVLPGGDGSANYHAFCKRIWKNSLSDEYLVAQLVAPRWSDDQFKSLVWPTEKKPWHAAMFTTEAFCEAVIADVEERYELDLQHVFVLAWSSGGPATYAYALRPDSRLTGAFVAMSVFRPGSLPSLKNAKGRAFYLLQSPEDTVTLYSLAEEAEKKLSKAKAEVELTSYTGGHGWKGDVFGNMRRGIAWLEKNHSKPPKRKKKKQK